MLLTPLEHARTLVGIQCNVPITHFEATSNMLQRIRYPESKVFDYQSETKYELPERAWKGKPRVPRTDMFEPYGRINPSLRASDIHQELLNFRDFL